MKSTNDDDDYFLSNAPENITDTNTSINSSFPIIIMPELLIIKGPETDAIQHLHPSLFFLLQKKVTHFKEMKVEGMMELNSNLKAV
jgi:hypothetical protein